MLGNLIYDSVIWAFQIYTIALVIYILMSWVPSMRDTKFGQFLALIVEPYLGFFRKFIPPLGMIDISPIVALFALNFIRMGVLSIVIFIF